MDRNSSCSTDVRRKAAALKVRGGVIKARGWPTTRYRSGESGGAEGARRTRRAESPEWLVYVSWSHRSGQDRAVQGFSRGTVRQRRDVAH